MNEALRQAYRGLGPRLHERAQPFEALRGRRVHPSAESTQSAGFIAAGRPPAVRPVRQADERLDPPTSEALSCAGPPDNVAPVAAVEQSLAGAAPESPDSEAPVEILSVKALPVVGVIVAALIAAIGTNSRWALDFFHVAGGGIWTALDLFLGFVLGPILGRLSISARVELTKKLMPKLVLIIPTLVTMTLAAGFQLARYNGMLDTSFPRHAWVVASFAVVGVMAVIAIGLLEPANIAVLFELRKPQPNPAVIEKLMRRFIFTAGITGAMQIGTLIIMTRLAS
jgi:hypothetical protein